MGVGRVDHIRRELLRHGRAASTPAAITQEATRSGQCVFATRLDRLATVARQQKVKPPSILLVGEVAQYAGRFEWFRSHRDSAVAIASSSANIALGVAI